MFLCFFPTSPVFITMPCRSQLAAAAGVAAVSLALLLRSRKAKAKAFPPAKAVEDSGSEEEFGVCKPNLVGGLEHDFYFSIYWE